MNCVFNVCLLHFINMKQFILENKYLILLWILTITALCFFTGHYNDILLDFGREIYYPQRILEGKVLYKDLFNIYGPFSYLFNALLYKIGGISLNTLYVSGGICSLLIVSGVFLISKKYLSDFLSFTLGIFTITTGVCATNLFSFTFPYSWGMLYGLVSFLYSLLFLIKFQKEEKPLFLYLSALLGGMAVTNKYDFLPYIAVIIFMTIKTKDWRIILKTFTSFVIVPLVCFGILFIQGMRFSDLVNYFVIVKKMASTETLKYFYLTQGVYFNKNAIPVWFINTLKTAFTLGAAFWGLTLFGKNKILSESIILLALCLAFSWFSPVSFSFFVILTMVLMFFRLKEKGLLLLTASVILISLKSFWGLTYMNYGNYFISMVLVSFFALLFSFISSKFQKLSAFYLLIISFAVLYGNILSLSKLDNKIYSNNGTIFTSQNLAESTNLLLGYINEKFENNSKYVTFPEGLMINYLAKTTNTSEDFYNSMLPLYVETFGEENIIKHFEISKPDYIILNNKNMKNYYYEFLCKDYALDFCGFILNNYEVVDVSFNTGNNYMIFKHKH